MNTLYRRPLPEGLVAFSSPEGKLLFAEALAHGAMEGWFPLAEQFHTQADPAFCGLGSLVVALNALGVDPQRLWKGPWRWFSEELLDCCVSLDEVRARGLTLGELACLARCNGVSAVASYAENADVDALRRDVREAASTSGVIVIASYSRRVLGQTGEGHFSPVGGIHRERDAALILDVARFKYPPHWVGLPQLHQAMQAVDAETGRSRGWLVLRRHEQPGGVLLSLSCRAAPWHKVGEAFDAPARHWRDAPPASLHEALAVVARVLPAAAAHIEWRTPVDSVHAATVERLRMSLESSPAGHALADEAGASTALAAAILYALPERDFDALPAAVGAQLSEIVDLAHLDVELAAELRRLREQLATIRALA